MLNLNSFPEYFRSYSWDKKHHLYGYPPDNFEKFEWILSLERRFEWLKHHGTNKPTASIYLFREMIQWGGSQNGVLQKFEDQLGETNLQAVIQAIVNNLHDPKLAIDVALTLPGLGLTYASKLLRFLHPERYGALDTRVRNALLQQINHNRIPKIYDGNAKSMSTGYIAFNSYVNSLKINLEDASINRPECALPRANGKTGWRSADIEMALFAWANPDEEQYKEPFGKTKSY
ncbi:hypothetical protein [Herminiimonas aquatilis]|uniref:Uncharacterized protein n=1 Tax=Herminiimonas aquatilis TaxID=345342 RepID=A0ABW2J334_9BURK